MTRRKGQAKKIHELLVDVEKKLKGAGVKFSVGDFLRLLEAEREFERDTPRDIEVTWIDSLTAQNESEA